MTTKQPLWTCEINNCGKGKNSSIYLLPDNSDGRSYGKTALCSRHYKEWLIIKNKYYELALQEFWPRDEK